ncbi:MAG: Exodeoxyribonuclease [Mucilaginibacter sp.]|nr:Exodeoxyribonuclease [Mucilaginibacter sp.]
MPATAILKLSGLASQVEQVINKTFNNLQFWVIAEVTNHSHKVATNYHYMELVEKAPGSDK